MWGDFCTPVWQVFKSYLIHLIISNYTAIYTPVFWGLISKNLIPNWEHDQSVSKHLLTSLKLIIITYLCGKLLLCSNMLIILVTEVQEINWIWRPPRQSGISLQFSTIFFFNHLRWNISYFMFRWAQLIKLLATAAVTKIF